MAFDNVPNKPVDTAEVKPKHEPEALKAKSPSHIIDLDLSHITHFLPPNITLFLPPKKTTAQVLREAADLIEEKGWGRGHLVQRKEDGTDGNYCILGALRVTSVEYDKFNIIAHYLANLLMPMLRGRIFGAPILGQNAVALYNDNIAGSRQEVIDFLRYAAKHAEVTCS